MHVYFKIEAAIVEENTADRVVVTIEIIVTMMQLPICTRISLIKITKMNVTQGIQFLQ